MKDALLMILDSNHFTELFVLANTILSWLVIKFKTKKSIAEKQYIQANKELALNYDPSQYYIIVNGEVYEYNSPNIKIIKKEDFINENKNKS